MKFLLSCVVVALAACATNKTPVVGATTTTTANPTHDEDGKVVECDLVCERAKLAVQPAIEVDYSVKALSNANSVLESKQPGMLACYKKRVAVAPNAHAFITVDVVIGPDGHVQSVETTGGALLGDQTTAARSTSAFPSR